MAMIISKVAMITTRSVETVPGRAAMVLWMVGTIP
jgi:hypothetical protein